MSKFNLASIELEKLRNSEISTVVYHGPYPQEANIMYQEFCKLRDTKAPLAIKGSNMALWTTEVLFGKIEDPTLYTLVDRFNYTVVVKGVLK